MLEANNTALHNAMAERGVTPPKAIKNKGRAVNQTPAHKTTNDIQNAITTGPLDKALILIDESRRKSALVGGGSKAAKCSQEV